MPNLLAPLYAVEEQLFRPVTLRITNGFSRPYIIMLQYSRSKKYVRRQTRDLRTRTVRHILHHHGRILKHAV